MKKLYILIPILAIGCISGASAYLEMCYDPIKNASTNGYDPAFLKLPIVLETCQESHKDLSAVGMKDLGYCSKELGTL